MKNPSPFNSAQTHKDERSLPDRDGVALREKIRERAYQLYEQRGRDHGHDREDWARAEEEVLDKQRLAKAA